MTFVGKVLSLKFVNQSHLIQKVSICWNHLPKQKHIDMVSEDAALHGKSILELWSVTCHMGSYSVTCHPIQMTNVPRHNPSHIGRYSIRDRSEIEG